MSQNAALDKIFHIARRPSFQTVGSKRGLATAELLLMVKPSTTRTQSTRQHVLPRSQGSTANTPAVCTQQ